MVALFVLFEHRARVHAELLANLSWYGDLALDGKTCLCNYHGSRRPEGVVQTRPLSGKLKCRMAKLVSPFQSVAAMRFLYTFVKHLPANIFIVVGACALGSVARAGTVLEVQERPPTLEFHLVDEAQHSGKVPPGDKLYELPDGSAILLKGEVVASGDDVADATATTTPEGPAVYIRLTARGAASMLATTRQNVGRRLAVLYNGRVISAAVIQGVFGARFEVADLTRAEARAIAMHFGATAGTLSAAIQHFVINARARQCIALTARLHGPEAGVQPFEIKEVSLASGHQYLVQGRGSCFCSPTGNCSFWVVVPVGDTFRVLLKVSAIQTAAVQPQMTRGHPDLDLSMHDSAFETTHWTYRFNGRRYRIVKCTDWDWQDRKIPDRVLSEPRIRSCQALQ